MGLSFGGSQVYLDPNIGSIVVGVPLISDYIMLRYDVCRRTFALQGFDNIPDSILISGGHDNI